MHTVFCDGKAPAEDMVLSALEKGMDMMGFSGHAYTSFDTSWCMSLEGTKAYVAEIRRLQEKYAGRIEILLGAEEDLYSDNVPEGCDYKIGSVHYIKVRGNILPVDESAAYLQTAAGMYFGGDLLALAECYYEAEACVLEKTGADVIGHFNLIDKFNENDCLFDTGSERYRKAWQAAADRLLAYGRPFEINTGAISRGYRTEPYPSGEMMQYIAERGGSFIMSSDSHAAETLLFGFEKWETYAREHGYRLMNTPCGV